jgi:hypothetical protein
VTVAFAALAGVACNAISGVDDLRFLPDAGSAGSGGGAGTQSASGTGGVPDAGCPERCSEATPPGWDRIGVLADSTADCPAGTLAVERKENPIASERACPCVSCTVDEPPECAVGTIPTFFGGQACTTTGVVLDNPNDGACDVFQGGGILQSYFKATPPPPSSAGTCSSVATPDDAAVSATAVRLCVATCEGSLCGVSGVTDCIAADGDVGCPSGPFESRRVVAASVSVSCASCPCTVSATCSGVLTCYSDQSCAEQVAALPVDGTCNATGANQVPIGSYAYAATAQASCTNEPFAAATIVVEDVQTVCCKLDR